MQESSVEIIRNSPDVPEENSRNYSFLTELRKQVFKQNELLGLPSRVQIAVWGALLCTALAISLSNFDAYQIGTHFDDARYIILAQSLVHSDQYGMINAPGEPLPGKYPFGYPILLAPMVSFFSGELDAFKSISLIASFVNATLLFWGWRWFSRTRSYWWAIGIVGLFILSPLSIDLSRRVMSDSIFTTFFLSAILLAERFAQGGLKRWLLILFSLVLLLVASTRTIGISVLISISSYLITIRGKKFGKDLISITVISLVMIAILIAMTPLKPVDLIPLQYLNEANASFVVGLGSRFGLFGSNDHFERLYTVEDETGTGAAKIDWTKLVKNYIIDGTKQHLEKDIRKAIIPIGGGEKENNFAVGIGVPFLPSLLGYSASGIVILGFLFWFVKEGVTAFNLSSVIYLGALFGWRWQDPRLLYPVQPQLLFAMLLGIEGCLLLILSLSRRKTLIHRYSVVVITLPVVILMALSFYKSINIEDSRIHVGDLEKRTSWLKENTSNAGILITEAPEIDYLYSGRKTVHYPPSFASAEDILTYIQSFDNSYILIAPKVTWQPKFTPAYSEATTHLLPLLDDLTREGKLLLVYSSERDRIKVYKLN